MMAEDTFLMASLAVWGAFLSTLLALIKIWEIWRSRARISVTYKFSDAEHGNEVIIENPSPIPVIVAYWELRWEKRKGWRREFKGCESADWDDPHFVIDGFSTHILRFQEARWFSTSEAARQKGKLYILLYISGRRKPLRLFVY